MSSSTAIIYGRGFETNKIRLNKIAARWPAKAVAQFYFY